jgi:hypothetical protein
VLDARASKMRARVFRVEIEKAGPPAGIQCARGSFSSVGWKYELAQLDVKLNGQSCRDKKREITDSHLTEARAGGSLPACRAPRGPSEAGLVRLGIRFRVAQSVMASHPFFIKTCRRSVEDGVNHEYRR